MLELQLQNIYGAENINSYVSKINGVDLSIKLGNYTIKEFKTFAERFDSCVKAITDDDKMLIFKVQSIKLSLIQGFIFDCYDDIYMISEQLLLCTTYEHSLNYAIYNIVTNEFIYEDQGIVDSKILGENGSAMIVFHKYIIHHFQLTIHNN